MASDQSIRALFVMLTAIAVGSFFISFPSSLANVEDLLIGDMVNKIRSMQKQIDKLTKKLEDLDKVNEQMDKHTEKAEDLNMINEKLDKLAAKMEYLETINKKNVARTCQELKDLGVTKSGPYTIDPDGPGVGDPPITVHCEMNQVSGVTEVPHDTRGLTDVNHCEEPGCDAHSISYQASDKQLKALITLSNDCSQSVSYSCLSSPLKVGPRSMAWWIGSNGVSHHYWDGKHFPTEHKCACAARGECRNNRLSCNCDMNLPVWTSDNGTLRDQMALPVKHVHFGGLTADRQEAKFELGPLKCVGRKPFKATSSCATLQQAGNTGSGYYLVDGADGVNYDLVQCNMDLQPDDPEIQVPTHVKLAEYPVAFHATMDIVDSHFETIGVIPYNSSSVNEGKALTPEGTFTAPLSGVFAFTFSTMQCDKGVTVLFLRVDGAPFAILVLGDSHPSIPQGNQIIPGTMSAIVRLRKGQRVDAFLDSGGICAVGGLGSYDLYTSFTGHLLYPTN